MEKFLPYLDSIGISNRPLLDRIEFLYKIAQFLCPEEIEDIFVTDFINNEGERNYENLWFFSQNFVTEAHNFSSTYHVDVAPIDRIYRLELSFDNYNFKKATPSSKATVRFKIQEEIRGNLKASGYNCDSLKDILTKHLKPLISK